MTSLLTFGFVLFTLLACSLAATTTSPPPSPPPTPATSETTSVDEIKITGIDQQSQIFPPSPASRATCGNFNIPKITSTTSMTGNYVLVKVTPTPNSFPTPTGLNTCSPQNFINNVCGASRVFIDDTFIPLKFSTYATSQNAPTAHFAQDIRKLANDFPLYQGKVTAMQERSASGTFVNINPIPSQVQLTQEVPFAIITNDDDFAWIAFITCDVNNPLTWVVIKENLISNQQQYEAYQNAFNQALRFSGVNASNMIDIPITDYDQSSSTVSNSRLGINLEALVVVSASKTTVSTAASPSPSPPPK